MRKYLIFLILTLILTLTACSLLKREKVENGREIPAVQDVDKSANNKDFISESKLGEVYSIALDSLMPIDEALNSNMEYIAIDTATLKDATEEDKKMVMKFFEKYGVKVIDESFESLKGKGMVKEGNSIDGILLKVDEIISKSDREAVIQVSKFRSGLGAIGVKSVVTFEGGKWKLKSGDMLWIS